MTENMGKWEIGNIIYIIDYTQKKLIDTDKK